MEISVKSKIKKSSHIVVKFCYYTLVILVIGSMAYFFKLLFAPLLASILFALVLDPVVNYFETAGFKRLHVLFGIYILLVLFAVCIVMFVVPKFIFEAQNFAGHMPQYKVTVKNGLTEVQQNLQQKLPNVKIPDIIPLIKNRMPGRNGINIDSLINNLSSFFALLSLVVIVPIVTFFLLADGHLIVKAFLNIIPNTYFEMSILLIHKIISSLKYFIRGQMIDAAAVGIMTTVGLAIIGVPYFLAIGIVAGIGNMIPYLGPIIGLVPALFAVVMQPGGLTALAVIKVVVVIVMVQFIEGTFIYPIAVGRSVNLHPLVVIIGVTVGGQIGGVLGMLIAVPLISIVMVTFEVLHAYLKSYSII